VGRRAEAPLCGVEQRAEHARLGTWCTVRGRVRLRARVRVRVRVRFRVRVGVRFRARGEG